MALKNKAARMMVAAFQLKAHNQEGWEKVALRAFEAEGVEEVVDAIENAEDDTLDVNGNDDPANVDPTLDPAELDAGDEDDDDDMDFTDDEVLEEVEAKVKEAKLKAAAKHPRKFL